MDRPVSTERGCVLVISVAGVTGDDGMDDDWYLGLGLGRMRSHGLFPGVLAYGSGVVEGSREEGAGEAVADARSRCSLLRIEGPALTCVFANRCNVNTPFSFRPLN